MSPKFRIIKKDSNSQARAGKIATSHGDILTPAFFPVGTKGTVKSLTPEQLKEIDVEAFLANTYHLHLQPGEGVIAKHGGIAKFMGWVEEGPHSAKASRGKPTMTDSGGFQVFSLGVGLEKPGVKFLKPATSSQQLATSSDEEQRPRLNRITEEGVEFQSHIDGSRHKLTPESSIAIQEKLGADLIVGFDDLESPTYNEARTKESLELTERWLLRSLKAHRRADQLLYGVTHGGQFESLRRESAKFVNKHFDAVALGGAHASKKNLYEVISWTVQVLEEEKPRQQVETKNTVKEYLDEEYTLTKREMDILDTIPSASVFMTKLGSKVLYDEIIGVSKQLMIILAEKESSNIPPGYEKSQEYSIKATQTYVEYARNLADGIYYKDTQKIKDAISKSREATGYLDLSGKLMPKKQ
mgnify:CR=1 FL=1